MSSRQCRLNLGCVAQPCLPRFKPTPSPKEYR